jgi:hypothetical protein
MAAEIKFIQEHGYLLAAISDTIITIERAQDILNKISTQCAMLGIDKVLLDERTVERREVPSHEIMALSAKMKQQGLSKVHIAFWCQPHLINEDAKLLSLFTFKNEYIIHHFSDKEEATTWLSDRHNH